MNKFERRRANEVMYSIDWCKIKNENQFYDATKVAIKITGVLKPIFDELTTYIRLV